MALPTFFDRVADSLRPVAEVDPDSLREKLEGVDIQLELAGHDPAVRGAFMLAANLAARLYPQIELAADARVSDATELLEQAREVVLAINPVATVHIRPARTTSRNAHTIRDEKRERHVRLRLGTLDFGAKDLQTGHVGDEVVVIARGWEVLVDPIGPFDSDTPGHSLAWLAAAAIGMAEVFRCVFADELGERGRRMPQPGGLNLLTSRQVDAADGLLDAESFSALPTGSIDIGNVSLIGAGAIGQAAAFALAHLKVSGRLQVVDPEIVTLSNLQRYLLTDATSVGASKVDLVRDALTSGAAANRKFDIGRSSGSSLEVQPITGRWGDLVEHLEADTVLVALDTAKDRIAVAGTLPQRAYNAWTQVADLGWSRHEQFGDRPCLACLYYPDRVRPSEHELISQALDQPQLRILAYLTYNIAIGYPLPGVPTVADLSPPDGFERWTQVSLLEDLISAGVVGETERSQWGNSTIGNLYRDGICAGGLLPVGDLAGEVIVPLAHQSAFAGIMLVAEVIWASTPHLAGQRDTSIEHRYDVLRGFPQISARPRQRTPNCFCSDPVYLAASKQLPEPTEESTQCGA